MKICTKCNIEKDESEFYKVKDSDKFYSACKSCGRERTIKYNNDHDYYTVNRTRILKNGYNGHKVKLETDPVYKHKHYMKVTMYNAFNNRGFTKDSHTEELLGCSYEFFHKYIENLFEPWMNWENYGNPDDGILELNKSWDYDHIIPLSSTNTIEGINKLCHYTNIRPLCSLTNRHLKRNLLDYPI